MRFGLSVIAWLFAVSAAMAAPFATQDKFTVIYSFNGTDGTTPTSGLTLGPHNAFYGSTSTLVFKLTLDTKHRWQQKKIAPAIASPIICGLVAAIATYLAYRLTARAAEKQVSQGFKYGQVASASLVSRLPLA